MIPSPFVAPPLPREAEGETADRLRWSALLLAQAKECGLPSMRVGKRLDGAKEKGSTAWFHLENPTSFAYHLRSPLSNQITFDLGDNKPDGTPTPWPDIVAHAHAVMDACALLGIQFCAGLSGGKGFHVEVFTPATDESRCADDGGPDRRIAIANRILAEAQRILHGDAIWGEDGVRLRVQYDHRFIAPAPGSVIVREWGERKAAASPLRRLLWHEGHGPAPRLPGTKAEAYRMAEAMAKQRGRVRPGSVCVSTQAAAHDTSWVKQMHGRPCPQGPQCFNTEDGWPTCSACPIGD